MQSIFAGRALRNRGGAIIAAVGVALLATILLIVYLHSYRSSVNSGKRPERVVVATGLIPQGTAGGLIARKGLYQVTSVQKDQLKPLALVRSVADERHDRCARHLPGPAADRVGLHDPGGDVDSVPAHGDQRAIAIPVDSAHGLIGQVANGNFVDVYVGVGSGGSGARRSSVRLLASNILVLVAPGSAGSNAILRVSTTQAPEFAYAADNSKIWLVLRPQVGAAPTPPTTANLATLLAGGK